MKTAQWKMAVLVFSCFLTLSGSVQDTFAQSVPHTDSIEFFLDYFEKTAIQQDFIDSIAKTKVLYKTHPLDERVVSELVNTENFLATIVWEDQLLNYKPFNPAYVFSFAQKILALSKKLPPENESPTYAKALNNYGTLSYHVHPEHKERVKHYEVYKKAFTILKKSVNEESADFAESIFYMAIFYRGEANNQLELEYAKKALIVSEKCGAKKGALHADCLEFLGDSYKVMFRYDTAVHLWEQALAERKKVFGESNPRYALYLFHFADKLSEVFQYDRAISILHEASELTIKNLGAMSLQNAYCIENIGCTYHSLGEYQKALPYYFQSIKIKEQMMGKDYPDLSLSFHNLATSYQALGDYYNALPAFQRAEELCEIAIKSGKEFDYYRPHTLSFLASIYEALGQYNEALRLLKYALSISEKLIIPNHHSEVLKNLGIFYENKHRYDSSFFYYQQLQLLTRKWYGVADPQYANSLDILSRLYRKTGKYAAGIVMCQQALAIRKKILGTSSPAYATSLNTLGELYLEAKKYDSASILLNQSLAIIKGAFGDLHPAYAKSLTNLGLLQQALGNEKEAAALFAEAGNIVLKKVEDSYATLSEQEKMNFINENYLQFSYLPSLLYNKKAMPPAILQQVYANAMMVKSMVLTNQQQTLTQIRTNADSTGLLLFHKWQINKKLLGKQLLLPIKQRLPFIDSLQQETNILEQQVSRRYDGFDSHLRSEKISSKDIHLQTGEVAIEFLTFRLYTNKWTYSTIYAASILQPGDSVPAFVPLCSEKQLERVLKPFADGDVWSINYLYSNYTAGNNLYKLIWNPLEKYLAHASTVYYAPVGLLHRISFAALQSDTNHFLIDKYQLTQLFSTRTLALSPAPIFTPSSASLWGNVQYTVKPAMPLLAKKKVSAKSNKWLTQQGTSPMLASRWESGNKQWKPLVGTRQEMDSVTCLFDASGKTILTLSDTSATEENFKALDGNSPKLLHIATHGFFYPMKTDKEGIVTSSGGTAFKTQQDPMLRSGLVLAGANTAWKEGVALQRKEDGILTAYEIAQMDLSNTDLVVLSACQTALGELQGSEGVIGLQRAFKMAGVKQVMMSLWQIPDKETTLLMTLFYKNWLAGKTTRQALYAAQLKMKSTYPKPYYWAGFVLVE